MLQPVSHTVHIKLNLLVFMTSLNDGTIDFDNDIIFL